jgi:hypothetical protein
MRKRRPSRLEQGPPPELRHDHGHDDVKNDGQQQRRPWHRDRGQAQQQSHNRRERHHHDRVVEGYLAEREMRLAIDKVRPHEHHGRAGSRRQQDQPGRIAVDLIGGKIRPEHMRDEDPGQQRHRKGFHQPVDPDRGRDSLPVRADGPERGKVDLEQHRNDHQPHQHCHR